MSRGRGGGREAVGQQETVVSGARCRRRYNQGEQPTTWREMTIETILNTWKAIKGSKRNVFVLSRPIYKRDTFGDWLARYIQ